MDAMCQGHADIRDDPLGRGPLRVGHDRPQRLQRQQRIAHRDNAAARPVGNAEMVAVGDDDRRHQRRRGLDQRVEVEIDQRLAARHLVADRNLGGKTAATQLHRVDADMHQQFDPALPAQGDGMAAGVQGQHLSVARRVQCGAERVDRRAVAQHPPGEHGIGHLVERGRPTVKRRGQLDGGHQCPLG